ncbi:MAG: Rieske 2Fe-2S domain-containing protein [Synechococcaceae cyanobacterium]|nr:Rieske 2Fe-2S domain-containing protein [Synechococcaceae cyanobacterium]
MVSSSPGSAGNSSPRASGGSSPRASAGDTPWGAAWRRCWLPVAYLEDLDRRRPTAFTLLEQDLVIWWDRRGGCWRVFADICPHRLVPLSEGRINSAGELECPYHGWSFAGDGHCTAIPQGGSADAIGSRRSRCRSYACSEAQGLLFVFSGEAEEASSVALPLLPEIDQEPGAWVVQDTFRDLPYDAVTLLENLLDASHVPFTHHRTIGRRENAGPVNLQLDGFDADGFRGTWSEGPRRGRLGSQSTTYRAPALMWHDLTAPGFARILTAIYAVPIRRGECRLFARFPFRFQSPLPKLLLAVRPHWLRHAANHTVLEDDQIFLHHQERVLESSGGSAALERSCYLPTAADLYVRALHDWILRHDGDPFPGVPLPPRQARTALLERYESHTRHCRVCSGALRGLRRWRRLLAPLPWLVLAAIAWLHTPAALLIGGGVALLAALLRQKLGQWEQALLAGDGKPPRNRD